MNTLIDIITSTSLGDLLAERDMLALQVEEAKANREEATRRFQLAVNRHNLAQYAVSIKEAMEAPLRPAEAVRASANGNGHHDATAEVFKIIRYKPGLKPKVINSTLEARGIPIRRNYLSTVLQRLKKRELVTVKDGAYYPAEE